MDQQYEACFKGTGYKMASMFSPRLKLPSIKQKECKDVNSTFVSSNKQTICINSPPMHEQVNEFNNRSIMQCNIPNLENTDSDSSPKRRNIVIRKLDVNRMKRRRILSEDRQPLSNPFEEDIKSIKNTKVFRMNSLKKKQKKLISNIKNKATYDKVMNFSLIKPIPTEKVKSRIIDLEKIKCLAQLLRKAS